MLQAIDNESFYDIESANTSQGSADYGTDPEILRENIINNRTSFNKTIMINRIVYILLLSSISFIIYDHHKMIGLYLSKIPSLF
jgi:hypothetical protein